MSEHNHGPEVAASASCPGCYERGTPVPDSPVAQTGPDGWAEYERLLGLLVANIALLDAHVRKLMGTPPVAAGARPSAGDCPWCKSGFGLNPLGTCAKCEKAARYPGEAAPNTEADHA